MDQAQSYDSAVRLFAVISGDVVEEIEKKVRAGSVVRTPAGDLATRRATYVRRKLVRKVGS